MRSMLLRSRLGLLAVFVAGIATAYVGKPLYRVGVMEYNQSDYGRLVFACDNAMREHFLAKGALNRAPSEAVVRELDAAQIGLLDCHEYDLERKRLIRWGLSQNDLATMELKVIERHGRDLRRVVDIHEIRF